MLEDAEYREIVQRDNVLLGEIKGAEIDEARYDGMLKAAHNRKIEAEARRILYTNYLKDAREEYEAAHPPEP